MVFRVRKENGATKENKVNEVRALRVRQDHKDHKVHPDMMALPEGMEIREIQEDLVKKLLALKILAFIVNSYI